MPAKTAGRPLQQTGNVLRVRVQNRAFFPSVSGGGGSSTPVTNLGVLHDAPLFYPFSLSICWILLGPCSLCFILSALSLPGLSGTSFPFGTAVTDATNLLNVNGFSVFSLPTPPSAQLFEADGQSLQLLLSGVFSY